MKTAREILGQRKNAEATGVLIELGWTDITNKATLARLMLWWKMPKSDSPLLRGMEAHANAMYAERTGNSFSPYNWWHHTHALLNWLSSRTGLTSAAMRYLPRDTFRTIVQQELWQAEFGRRWVECALSERLETLGEEVATLTAKDFWTRTQWPGAPYQEVVDDRYHVRMLAKARLGLLPIEIETGRWLNPPTARDQRWCALGCAQVGDLRHFCYGCEPLRTCDHIDSVYAIHTNGQERKIPPAQWRGIATRLAIRWRERQRLLHAEEAQAAGDDKAFHEYVAQLGHDPVVYERSDIRAHFRVIRRQPDTREGNTIH